METSHPAAVDATGTHTGTDQVQLSVIVPFYGVEDYIEACLESIATQALESIEVILVDDGSPDASHEIAQRFVERDSRFRLIRQENAGLGPARNTGAAAARGRYLTFVDSDDIVSPRGFWTMVHTLDETGSDFAAANAWRFTDERGTYQSWTHERPFAKTQLRTTLAERSDLIGDRMAWNKVYRRSFWQEHRFAFPAMRYEDYPVSIAAYLCAASVDVLHDHVYLWRDRESGTSITQQRADLSNARDRYASDLMVLEALDHYPTTVDVHRRVRTYLAWVDVPSLATTMALTDTEHHAEAAHMAQDLAVRTRTHGLSEAPRSVQLINDALLRGDITTAGDIAAWRAGGGARQLVSSTVRSGRPGKIAALAGMVVSSKAPQHVLKPRRLRSSLVSATWADDQLTLVIDSRLRADVAKLVHTQVYTHTSADGVRWPVESVSTPTSTGVRTTVTFEGHAVQGVSDERTDFAFELMLTMPGGTMRWRGPVSAAPHELPEPYASEDSTLVLTANPELCVTVLPTASAHHVRVDATEDTFTLHLTPTPPTSSVVRLVRPMPPGSIDVPVTGAEATISVGAALADDRNDDPLGDSFTRVIELVTPDGVRPMYLMGGTATLTTGEKAATVGRDGEGQLCLCVDNLSTRQQG